ncbi:MAG TPA: uroporphyrinogen decarboxylase family protein [Armatimonadota bacterium]|jgi:uroporphyrinogen decarboxylase
MTSRERMELALDLKEADRIPRCESFWPETLPLWRQQGMRDDTPINELFDYDIVSAGWVNHEARPGLVELIAESDEWHTRRDGHGAVLRYWKNKSGTPEHVEFTVNTPDAWAAHKKELLKVPIHQRVNLQQVLWLQEEARRNNRWFCWGGVECFEMAKDILGHEILCCAMAEDPDWAADVYMTLATLAVSALDYLETNGVRYDGAWVYGDIAYNHGPFCSPRMYRRLVMPAHQKQIGWFKDRGMKVIYHTDGDFRPLIPSFLDVGINCFQPLEAKAHIDVRELKPLYGDRVAFMGNIDIMVLITNDREKVEEEVAAKVPLAMKGGGYIYHSDHSIPPGVTWQTYEYLMELIDRYGRYR